MTVVHPISLDILNAIHNGAILFDENNQIIFWNKWMESYSGLANEKVLGSTLQEVFPNEQLVRLQKAIKDSLKFKQSAVLSHSIHPSLFPLHQRCNNETTERIKQSIIVKPFKLDDKQKYSLVLITDITSAYQREQVLRRQSAELQTLADKLSHDEARARAIIENIHDALITVNENDEIIDFNNAAHRLFGYEDSDILGHKIESIFKNIEGKEIHNGRYSEALCINNLNKTFPAEVAYSSVPTHSGMNNIWIIRNLSARKQVEEKLYREKEFAQITLQSIQEAVLTTDEYGSINSANDAACKLLRKSHNKIIDRPLLNIITFKTVEQRQTIRSKLDNVLSNGHADDIGNFPELIFENKDIVRIEGRISALRSAIGQTIGSVVVMQDVTLEQRMQEILSHQATHDDLTNLINRREFERRLEDLVIRANIDSSHSILLYLDLDQFKLINDTCGHDAGDQLLRQLTGLIRTRLRQTDTLARLGGDEFAALLPGCSIEVGKSLAEKIRETVNEFRFNWSDRNFSVGVSIGLVPINDAHDQTAAFLKAADSACYMAKEAGRNQVVIYHSDGDEEKRRHTEMFQATRIRDSLEQNHFRLHCQPIVPTDMMRNSDWGIEILVRMVDNAGTIVPPMTFIPAAERYSLMMHIDRWVVDEVCEQWSKHPKLFERLDKVAINLSGQSIANDEFLAHVIKRIENKNLPWNKICFEITETAAVASIEKARHFMNELSKHGCRFALDDFGSGLSSFTYLKHLPVDFLKIDGAFVKDMLTDKIDAAMVRSISEIGTAMGLMTIAEFVEDTEVIEALREANVDYAQGYGICRPIPLEEIANFSPKAKKSAKVVPIKKGHST